MLVTPLTLQRKHHRLALKRRRDESPKNAAQKDSALFSSRVKEEKAKRSENQEEKAIKQANQSGESVIR
jgi:small subunit ribosomal protein S6e